MGTEAEKDGLEFATPEERGDLLPEEKEAAEAAAAVAAEAANEGKTEEELAAEAAAAEAAKGEGDDNKTEEELAAEAAAAAAADDDGTKGKGGDDDDDKDKKGAKGEGDGDEKGAKEEGAKPKNKRIKVPKFRLDAANTRARNAEDETARLRAENERLKAGAKKGGEAEKSAEETRDEKLADIDTRLADALKEGKTEDVPKLMAESRTVEREFIQGQTDAAAASSTTEATAQMQETTRLNSVLDQLEAEFPIFDENSDTYDQEANDKILAVQQTYIKAGSSPSDALIEAANLVLPSLGIDMADEADDKGDDKDCGKKPESKKTDVKKNLDTSKKQPPELDDAGDDSDSAGKNKDVPDSRDLTEEEFDALPEATKKQMRGDVI